MEWAGTTDESRVEIDLFHCGDDCRNSVSRGRIWVYIGALRTGSPQPNSGLFTLRGVLRLMCRSIFARRKQMQEMLSTFLCICASLPFVWRAKAGLVPPIDIALLYPHVQACRGP